MARIVGGSPIGMLSGKEGGRVFSFNKAGQYTRQYVKPVNPATIAQGRARSAFANASSSFHSLTPAQKATWAAYAAAQYNPKIGSNMGQFSGFNAYVALRQVVASAQTITQTVTPTVNGSALGTPATFDPFSFSNTPPTTQLQSNIELSASAGVANLNLVDATINDDGSFDFQLQVDSGVPAGANIEDFVDGGGNEFGFLVQMSNPKTQGGLFYENPFRYTLGYIEHPNFDVSDRTGVQTIEFASTSNVDPADYQSFPVANEVVKMTVYSASKTGMLALIGDIEVTIS